MRTINDFGTDYQTRVINAVKALKKGQGVILLENNNMDTFKEVGIVYPASTIDEMNMASILNECSDNILFCLSSKSSIAMPTISDNIIDDGAVSIEASAFSRVMTIMYNIEHQRNKGALLNSIFISPLITKENGLLGKREIEEGSVDIVKLANLGNESILVKLSNLKYSVINEQDIISLVSRYNSAVVYINDIYKYIIDNTPTIERGQTALLPTEYGFFKTIPYKDLTNGLEHLVLFKGEWKEDDAVLVRIHSSCATGDIFSSCRCDCGKQLHKSLAMIEEEGCGVVVYLNQEGRGIGLCNKIHAYKLQDEGMDTIEANIALGFKADERGYAVGANILKDLKIKNIRLITNNPDKINAMQNCSLNVKARVPVVISSNGYDELYLKTKKEKMGHFL